MTEFSKKRKRSDIEPLSDEDIENICIGIESEYELTESIRNVLNNCEKTFVAKIYQGDLKYLKNNYSKVRIKNRFLCFMISILVSESTMLLPDNAFLSYFISPQLRKSKGIPLIEFMLTHFKIDPSQTLRFVHHGYTDCYKLSIMCHKEIIFKYLIERFNVTDKSLLKEYLFFAVCRRNYYNPTNINIIRYLVEEKNTNINISFQDNPNSSNELLIAAISKYDIDVIIYLIKKMDDIYRYDLIRLGDAYDAYRLTPIVAGIQDDYKKLNLVLEVIRVNNLYGMSIELDKINPLMIDYWNRQKYRIENPYNEEWNKFIIMVDQLKSPIPFPLDRGVLKFGVPFIPVIEKDEYKTIDTMECPDYTVCTKDSEKLFLCNGTVYYGSRNILYRSMIFFKDIKNECKFDPLIELSIKIDIPKYIINHYINASYTDTFDLNCILPSDITAFIRFIDRHPTTIISIEKLEKQIIDFFEKNKLNYNDDLRNIFIRYRLKYIYLHMHNNMLKKMEL